METKDVITINDYNRLSGLIRFASLETKMPETIDRLHAKLKGAIQLPQDQVLNNVVTMNSRVLLKEVSGARKAEVTVTYPQDTDGREGKISVFSPIGLALLGRQAGDIVSWKIPGGTGSFRITEIVYQPEAAGHYYL